MADLVGLKDIGISVENTNEWLDSPHVVKRFEELLRRVLRFDSKHIAAAMIIDELRNMEKEFGKAREKLEGVHTSLPCRSNPSYSGKRSFLMFPWAKKAGQVSSSSLSIASASPSTFNIASNKSHSIRTSVKWKLIDKKTSENVSKPVSELSDVLYKFPSLGSKGLVNRQTSGCRATGQLQKPYSKIQNSSIGNNQRRVGKGKNELPDSPHFEYTPNKSPNQ
ncbi:hypothetical protein QBC36DRAFT_314615 [Triangularia setosa]|uniref:Uncharacterized protein n=1 Tax=Triangularia setosa TaxID=2587417 RepID=A0AAN6W0J0_9PEZI|nr:hypothetical protein QBC36DRAFT_314615 [Podospora setosa]